MAYQIGLAIASLAFFLLLAIFAYVMSEAVAA